MKGDVWSRRAAFGWDIMTCLYAGKNNPIEEKTWSCRREKNISKENSLNGLETIVFVQTENLAWVGSPYISLM